MADNTKNESDLMFESYLIGHGYTDWAYETPLANAKKQPDYRLTVEDFTGYFDVKEFEAPPPYPQDGPEENGVRLLFCGAIDPHSAVRSKINEARKQFKEYKDYPCGLVLANPNGAREVFLHEWRTMYDCMLGNPGFQVPVGADALGEVEYIRLGGGKMVDYKRAAPQNTTFSAILAVQRYPLRQAQIRVLIRQAENALGRKVTQQELIEIIEANPDPKLEDPMRVFVYENPFARMPLPRELFRGPYDQRWGDDGTGHIGRVFVGDGIAELEAAE